MPDTIGAMLRAVRKKRKMTLDRVSELTGISVSSLSRIENTQLGLTVEKIELLAHALEITPEDLISRNHDVANLAVSEHKSPQEARAPRMLIDRERNRKASAYRELNAKYLFDPDTDRSMECMQCTIASISIWDSEFVRHPGEKIIYVLRGDLLVYCEGRPPVILEASDALFMDANVWHSTVAIHGQPAELLVTYYHGPEARQGLFETQTFTPESWVALQGD